MKRTWIENCTCDDGTEYIIFRNNGVYEVFEYYFSDDGERVFTGTLEQCNAYVNERWVKIAENMIW